VNGWKIARALRRRALVFGAAALGTACDVSSVVGYQESALGALRCAADAPIARCETASCVVQDLEPAQVGSTAIAVDEEFVYNLREASVIVKTPLGGGAATELAISEQGVFRMAVDAESLFYTEFGRRIFRVPKAGGPVEVVADIDGHPTVVALDETYVYAALTDTNQLVMTSKEPGRSTFLPGQAAPFWVATDASHVYWINQGNAPNTGQLVRAPLGDLTLAEVLLEGLDSPVTLALSERDAYLVAGEELLRVGKDGGAAEIVLTGLDETKSTVTYSDSIYLTGISGFLRVRAGEALTLDTRTTLGLAVACSGVVATGWLTPALLRYAP
jgi:hypothetical protein